MIPSWGAGFNVRREKSHEWEKGWRAESIIPSFMPRGCARGGRKFRVHGYHGWNGFHGSEADDIFSSSYPFDPLTHSLGRWAIFEALDWEDRKSVV
jgi:hypothetical protein